MDKTRIFEAAGKLSARGQFDKAAKEYQRILEEDPKDVRALQKLAEIHQRAGRTQDAVALLLRVAESYTEQGFFLKAVAVYKQVLKSAQGRVDVHLRLAQLYQQLGLIGDATAQYQIVVDHHDQSGQTREALSVLRRLVDLDPDNVASRVKLGELYARERLVTEAIGELRRAAVHLERGGRRDDAVRVLERMGQIDPSDTSIALELARHYLDRGDTRRALARLQVCFRAKPTDVETLTLLARAFTNLGQTAKTVSVYRELARVLAETDQHEARRATLERIVELVPGDPEATEALQALGPAPASHTPPPPARAEPGTAPVSVDVPASVSKLLSEADVYLKYGLVVRAAEHLQRASAMEPRSLVVHEKLFAVLDRQGRTDDALRTLVRLVELARDAGDADRERAFIQELGQRAPSHPIVQSSAAAAELPPADEEVVEPDEDDFIEGIEVDAEFTLTPAPPPSVLQAEPEIAWLQEEDAEDAEIVLEPEPAEPALLDPAEMEEVAEAEVVDDVAPFDDLAAFDDGAPFDDGAAFDDAAPFDDGQDERFAEEIAEAEFLVQQGLPDDARAMLEFVLEQAPDHAGARALLDSLEPSEPALAEPAPGGFDLASELADEFDSPRTMPIPTGDLGYSVADVLEEFKRKVTDTIGAEDSQTHYDLGIAYREMGLIDEALHEFEVALTGHGHRRVIDCLTMLGVCWLDKDEPARAMEYFQRALKTPGLTLEASKEAHYQIGHCHERLGRVREALSHYSRVYKADPSFRDVRTRAARLAQRVRQEPPSEATGTPPPRPPQPSPQRPESGGPPSIRGKIGYV